MLDKEHLYKERGSPLPEPLRTSEALSIFPSGRVNSSIRVVEHQVRFTAANALDLVRPYDVIVDASDNVATRYVVNDACVVAGKVSPLSLCSRFPAIRCVRSFIFKVCHLGWLEMQFLPWRGMLLVIVS